MRILSESTRPWRSAVLLAVAMVLAALPASAVPATGQAAASPEAAAAQRTVDHVRAAMSAGTFSARVGGLLAVDEGVVTAMPDVRVNTGALTTVAPLPADLRAPVAGLHSAVAAATAHLGTLTVAELARAMEAAPAQVATVHREAGQEPVSIIESSPATAEAQEARTRSADAATMIAGALDAHLPALRAAAGAVPSGVAVEGCDLLDALPALCVGSEADNIYTADAALLIDLGGDDIYHNTAGGAPFELPGSPHADVMSPVSVNVDLSGDDRYQITEFNVVARATAVGNDLTALIGQGMGWFRAVGILADLDGEDSYTIQPPPPGDPQGDCVLGCSGGRIFAQGSADNGGFGMLFDAAGADDYTVAMADGPGSYHGNSNAQGAAVVGVGGLLDEGGDADTYTIDVGHGTAGSRPMRGQGYGGVGGTGVLYDHGGADSFRMVVAASSGPAPANSTVESSIATCPNGGGPAGFCVGGQGMAGTGGQGLLLTGPGPNSYEMLGDNVGAADFHWIHGQGVALGLGIGVLDDAGGDDRYLLDTSLTGAHDLNVDDTDRRARHFLDVSTNATKPFVMAQGSIQVGGVGVLSDRGAGDDQYDVNVRQEFSATFHDVRTSADGPLGFELIGYTAPTVQAQGSGNGGTLRDEAGSDTYAATATSDAHVRTGEITTGYTPVASAVALGRPNLAAQGSGGGAFGTGGRLLDLAGAHDTFSAAATNRATAPDPDLAYAAATTTPTLHGADAGTFTALGDSVEVLGVPARPVCAAASDPGRRGFGRWADRCPQERSLRVAGGYVPSAIGRPTTLSFTDDSLTGAADTRVSVSAKLVDTDGTPVEGAVVNFELRYQPTPSVAGYALWHMDGITDAAGVARASLPTRTSIPPFLSFDPTRPVEVRATYHGDRDDPGLHPAHATTPLSLR